MLRPLALSALLLLSPTLFASDQERLRQADFPAQRALEQTRLELKNQAVLNYLWLDVYAAALYTEPRLRPAQATASQSSKRLELYYFRDIERDDLIEAAWVTLRRQHAAATLERLRPGLDALHSNFRDIRPGDRYALNYSPRAGLSLEHNGVTVFTSDDAELASAYLGIWLAPNGLSEQLRDTLLANPGQ
ncbi:chalcone isomerase family protein [Pseudomonas benzenivorans]|uniref:Chalcone isomerase family protein n=1 Tax=Pseudomonas benzenivorans TaxID=556533 RepID=A0ABY5H7W5_9PSED|nr:chalcone isomerase family protein [Pseudomonas benzenivorans]UTW08413.1 chalcone isomerase family protein [Pseudomonas benzenivorans]